MYRYKKSVLILLICSLCFSHQYENYFNGAIPSATKTPKKGKINLGISIGGGMFSQSFNSDGKLVDLGGSTSFSALGLGLAYHGFNGCGVEIMIDDNSESDGATALNVYFVWNEMYTDKSPAFIPWQHSFTFPLTRNVTTIQYLSAGGEDYPYLKHAMDLILSTKSILSMQFALTNDTETAGNMLSTDFIYDINDDFSFSAGLNHYASESSNKTSLLLQAGYQFKDVSTGNLKMNFKLIPQLTYVLAGENVNADHNFNLNFQTYFN